MPTQTNAVGMERKLAAIFSTDVAGYSRLMGDDEEATIRTLTASRAVISSLIQHYRGRVVDAPGDNLLAEFASVVDAVRCAVEIQQALKTKNAELPEHRQMQFRIGINLGDVIVEGERIYGDGVNIAARLESLAEPGGICISSAVYEQVKSKLALNYEDLGAQAVKNIVEPVRTYRVVMDEAAIALAEQVVLRQAQHERTPTPVTLSPSTNSGQALSKGAQRKRKGALLLVGLLLIAVALITVRYLPSPVPDSELSTPNSQSQPLAPSTQPLPLPDKPSIVVLPFDNLSKDPAQDYFSNGLTEVLTSDLSRISSLFVIARNTAFTYQGKPVNLQAVGKELGVRYVLEGSVQKAGEHIRIVTQLIDTTTGGHLWAQRYDRPVHDLFALQDEIVQKIVTTLRLQLTLQEQGFIVRKHTNNFEAYDAFLRGMGYHWGDYTKEAIAQAQQMYEKAFALDPQYADAYVWLGWTYTMEWGARWSTDPQALLERTLALAQKAIALDNSLPVAHLLLSYVSALQQQYDQALAESERAIALDPNNADSYAIRAGVLNFAGRPEEALRMMEQAVRLNPGSPPWYLLDLGQAYYRTGRYAQAIATLKELISRSPNYFAPYPLLALNYVQQWAFQQSPDSQTLEQALATGQRAIAIDDTVPWSHWALGTVYLWQKQYDQALAEMKRAITLDPNEALNFATLAEALSYVGRSEDALEAAEQALRLKPFVVDAHLNSVGAAYAVAGRYEEARAPLQRYLSRYPNILGAHLTLAAVYSELGQDAEAQAEAAEVLRLNPKFSLEVHKQRMPIKDPAVLERHIAALRKAGLK